jgi:hypothetical protein
LADVTLSDFLARLGRETVVTEDGGEAHRWVYDPAIAIQRSAGEASLFEPGPRFVLIIDPFEELITGHPERWEERADFFQQLNGATHDPAGSSDAARATCALDPCTPCSTGRFPLYMERTARGRARGDQLPCRVGGGLSRWRGEALVATCAGARPGSRHSDGAYVQPVQLQAAPRAVERTAGKRSRGDGKAGDAALGNDDARGHAGGGGEATG